MAHRLRDRDPEIYKHITIRTVEGRLWMHPSRKTEKLLGGIIARYQELLGIKIYAYCFLGNHFHLIINAPLSNTDEFCENVNREISRRVNWKFQREGQFWARRYDDLKILRREDLMEAFAYVTTNAVKHGLVRHPVEWPGLNSYNQSLSGRDRIFTFYHYSATKDEPKFTRHKIKLSILPDFEELSKEGRVNQIRSLIEGRSEFIAEERRNNGEGFLGIKAIMTQVPGSLPKRSARSNRPSCYSKCAIAIKQYRAALRRLKDVYWECSARYRLGETNVEFPQYCYRPPLHRLPRISPFKPLPFDYFQKLAAS